jgi:1-acyl-sn-glycerol-3-phosphate acyltransferase
MRSFLRWLVYTLVRGLVGLFVRVEVEGRENLPAGGPLLVIGNHFSIFDGPLLYIHLPYRPLVFLAASDLVHRYRLGFLLDLFEAIPVYRGTPDRAALHRAVEVLEGGGVLGIMPEGAVDPVVRDAALAGGGEMPHFRERRVAELVEPRAGAAFLAVRTEARVLPVGIIGAQDILPNARRLRRTTVRMVIGPPFGPLAMPPDLHGKEKRDQMDAFGHEMMRHIAGLLPAAIRGPYG